MPPHNGTEKHLFSETQKVSDTIKMGTFQVPWHQREYDWDEPQVLQFWNDIHQASQNQEEPYYIGPIVLTHENGYAFQIQDGQQRLVTYSLLCQALRQASNEQGDPNSPLHNASVQKILFNVNADMPAEHEIEQADVRIQTPKKNKANYLLIARDAKLKPNGKLKKAWHQLKQKAKTLSPEERHQLISYVLNNVVTVRIDVGPEKATQVFETINARGITLKDVDLIRNHLYAYFGVASNPQKQAVHNNLVDLRDQFDGNNAVERMGEYVRCYMQCSYGHIEDKTLYQATKTKLAEATQKLDIGKRRKYIHDLVADLTAPQHIRAYFALEMADVNCKLIQDFIADAGSKQNKRNMADFIYELKEYKVSRPVMLAVLIRYIQEANPKQKKAVARAGNSIANILTTLILRTNIIVQQFAPATIDHLLAKQAQVILQGLSYQTLKTFLNEVKRADRFNVLDDKQFKERAQNVQIKAKKKARLILGSIYRHQQQDIHRSSDQILTLEHILPESIDHLAGWPDFDDTSHALYHARLGNLTLLSSHDNKSKGFNTSFANKQQTLEQSSIQQNRDIAKRSNWTQATIDERQEQLIKLACQVWSTNIIKRTR